MPDISFKGRAEDLTSRRLEPPTQDALSFTRPLPDDAVIDFSPYLRALWRARAWMMLAEFLVLSLTIACASLLIPKSYRAMAIIRPVAQTVAAGRLVGEGAGGATLSSLSGLLGQTPANESEAEEYMTILRSFAFTISLIERHKLADTFFRASSNKVFAWMEDTDPRWRGYNRIKKSFSCDYSLKTGNVRLYFEASSPSESERILGYYIQDLRNRLISRETQNATAAIRSLTEQASDVSDPLLRTQLFELIARQMQELRLAQIEADFAFRVLEPPAAPDKPYSPDVLLDTLIAGLLTILIYSLAVIVNLIRLRCI